MQTNLNRSQMHVAEKRSEMTQQNVPLSKIKGSCFSGGPVVWISPSNAEGVGSIPGQETKILQAS